MNDDRNDDDGQHEEIALTSRRSVKNVLGLCSVRLRRRRRRHFRRY